MVNRGVFMTPGDEEQWTLSVQHTEADIDRYVDAFAELCAELAQRVKRRPPDVLDDSDKAIVELLQEDGRMSYTRIAAGRSACPKRRCGPVCSDSSRATSSRSSA